MHDLDPTAGDLDAATPHERWFYDHLSAACRDERYVAAARQLAARTQITWENAGLLLAHDAEAVATEIGAVRFCDGDAYLLVSAPVEWDRDRGWLHPFPSLGLQTRQADGGFTTDWHVVTQEVWRAASALLAALYATPHLGASAGRVGVVRTMLVAELADLVRRRATAREAIDDMPEQLRGLSEFTVVNPWPARAEATRWPRAHAALLHALDHFAGRGGDQLLLPIKHWTWVEVWDRPDVIGARAAGWVVDPPALLRDDRTVRLDEITERDESELTAYVRIGDDDERIRFTQLRRPRRSPLFG